VATARGRGFTRTQEKSSRKVTSRTRPTSFAGRGPHPAGQHIRPGVGGPLPDRGERPRSRDHRRDPGGTRPGKRMPPPAFPARIRDLSEEIEQVLAAGSRNSRRCHRPTSVPRGRQWLAQELPSFRHGPAPCPPARRHAGHTIRRYDAAGHNLNSRLCRVPGYQSPINFVN
jgi:hypothetical protein